MHMYNLLDPIDTIWMKGIHVYSHLEVVATETRRRPRGGQSRNEEALGSALPSVIPCLLPAAWLLVYIAERRVEGF